MEECTIVLAEKAAAARKKTAAYLSRKGFRVITARDGIEALQKVLASCPHGVLAGTSLTELQGPDLNRFLKSDSITGNIPFILLGSEKDRALVEEGILSERELYTGKPDSEAFVEVLSNAVQRSIGARKDMRPVPEDKSLHHVTERALLIMNREQALRRLHDSLCRIPFQSDNPQKNIDDALDLFQHVADVKALVMCVRAMSRTILLIKLSRPATEEYLRRLRHIVAGRINVRGFHLDPASVEIKVIQPPADGGELLSGDILFYGEPLAMDRQFNGFAGIAVSTMAEKAALDERFGLIRAYFHQAYTVIENACIKDVFSRLSTIDSLTQVSNRNRIIELLKKELVRARRYFLDLSVILFDIDNFKTINDFYGYQVGDVILKDLARITADTMRNIDEVGRYGGEEFLVILPETNLKSAEIAGGRIKSRVQNHVFPGIAKDIRISLSIGITSYLRDVDISVDDMLRRTDLSLLEAKKRGKNCVCVMNK